MRCAVDGWQHAAGLLTAVGTGGELLWWASGRVGRWVMWFGPFDKPGRPALESQHGRPRCAHSQPASPAPRPCSIAAGNCTPDHPAILSALLLLHQEQQDRLASPASSAGSPRAG